MHPARNLRRVRKEDVQIVAEPKKDGLSICLECWKLYMSSDDRDLSASRMKLYVREEEEEEEDEDGKPRQGYDSNPYDDQRKADMKIGEATNTMIDDLKPAWRWSIYRMCGITTQWKFTQLDYMTVAIAAQEALREKLQKSIDTATLF